MVDPNAIQPVTELVPDSEAESKQQLKPEVESEANVVEAFVTQFEANGWGWPAALSRELEMTDTLLDLSDVKGWSDQSSDSSVGWIIRLDKQELGNVVSAFTEPPGFQVAICQR